MDQSFTDTLLKVLISAAVLLVPILATVLAAMLKRYLAQLEKSVKARASKEQYQLLHHVANISVLAAEQQLNDNAEKFAYAETNLINYANDNGIPLTYDQSRALIEGILKGFKQGFADGT